MKERWVTRICLALLVMAMALLPANTISADPGWSYQRTITIDSNKVSGTGTLTNFPVLISLGPADWLKYQASGDPGHVRQPDGGDIVFTKHVPGPDYTKLDHEIEKYDGATGTLVAWVEIPSLSGSSPDTQIYMLYGNATCDDQWNITGTWDNYYIGVWHLKEDAAGTGTTDLYQDSTTNDNDGDDYVSATGKTGKIGAGQKFDGSDDYVQVASTVSQNVDKNITLECWVYIYSYDDWDILITKGNAAHDNVMHEFSTVVGDNMAFDFGTNGDWHSHYSGANIFTTVNWYHLAVTYGGNEVRFYKNGNQFGTYQTENDSMAIYGTGEPIWLGGTSSGETVNARIDEARISNTARSADWIKTSYNNQSDTTIGSGYFVKSLGPEGSATAVTLSSFAARSGSRGSFSPWPWLGLVGLAALGLGGVVWAKRRLG